jgi:hypothetical protein
MHGDPTTRSVTVALCGTVTPYQVQVSCEQFTQLQNSFHSSYQYCRGDTLTVTVSRRFAQ